MDVQILTTKLIQKLFTVELCLCMFQAGIRKKKGLSWVYRRHPVKL